MLTDEQFEDQARTAMAARLATWPMRWLTGGGAVLFAGLAVCMAADAVASAAGPWALYQLPLALFAGWLMWVAAVMARAAWAGPTERLAGFVLPFEMDRRGRERPAP